MPGFRWSIPATGKMPSIECEVLCFILFRIVITPQSHFVHHLAKILSGLHGRDLLKHFHILIIHLIVMTYTTIIVDTIALSKHIFH
jgi:hypothetical protein